MESPSRCLSGIYGETQQELVGGVEAACLVLGFVEWCLARRQYGWLDRSGPRLVQCYR